MRIHIKSKLYIALAMALSLLNMSCNEFLEREPLSVVTPEAYLHSEADLAAYTIANYAFPTHSGWNVGTFGYDNHTDNQATTNASNRWIPGEYRIGQTGGSWSFGQIRDMNYFLETVVPRWKAGGISGSTSNVEHYVGEGYFLRAYEYFNKVQNLGDFPIVKNTLPDDLETLTEISIRKPRNEVARFIISDLDSAINLLLVSPPGGKNRINQMAALTFKSRVALHEATWLLYHKGTAHVPGGPGWPGEADNPNFSLDIDQEIDYFLGEAMEAAELVADQVSLTSNTLDNGYDSSENPYHKMFGDLDMSQYEEVLLWRQYDHTLGIRHNINAYINSNGGNTGYTKGLVESFLMANGLPIYADGSGYHGDDFIADVKADRDNRLQLFMKDAGEVRLIGQTNADGSPVLITEPEIIGNQETKYVTGYGIKKGFSYLPAQTVGEAGTVGSMVFRAAEAYLNYIEASYLAKGSIDAKAAAYWEALRVRAGVSPDFNLTIANTVISKEAEGDMGAYSAGEMLSDPILYNIRRERRNELIAEGMRYFDLKRWRALDQLKTDPYIVKGFKLWGPMQSWYVDEETSETLLIPAGSEGSATPNVSNPDESDYLLPYRIMLGGTNLVKDGYEWASAHYLEPIAIQHFIITSPSGDPSNSVIYQNPGWSLQANEGALE